MLDSGTMQKGFIPFAAFCLASSATYIFNDIRDRESDSIHPKKKLRPIARGVVTVRKASLIGIVLLIVSVFLALSISSAFFTWLIAYLGLAFAYSYYLKDQPVFDIFCIASGFVFRLFAGGAAFDVEISDWLFLSVLLLALFLSAGKRLGEKKMLGDISSRHRKSLSAYPDGVLDGFVFMSGAAVLVTYTMYAITMQRLIYTDPLCCFGLFRYMVLVKSGNSGDPTDLLTKDPVLFMVGLAWAIMVGSSIYLL